MRSFVILSLSAAALAAPRPQWNDNWGPYPPPGAPNNGYGPPRGPPPGNWPGDQYGPPRGPPPRDWNDDWQRGSDGNRDRDRDRDWDRDRDYGRPPPPPPKSQDIPFVTPITNAIGDTLGALGNLAGGITTTLGNLGTGLANSVNDILGGRLWRTVDGVIVDSAHAIDLVQAGKTVTLVEDQAAPAA